MIGSIFNRMAIHHQQMPDDLVRLYRQQACEPGALTAMLNYYRAALRGGGAIRQQRLGYPTIHVPTLVLWGLQDRALVAQNLNGLSVFSTNLKVVRFPDAGHFVHEDKPEEVTRELLIWLRNHSRS
jgi:epoxide hydrolase 4